MRKNYMDSVSSSDLIETKLEEHRMSGSKQCPSCGHKLEFNKPDWVGLPAGVKFDPTDQELIEHLEAKVSEEETRVSHPLIDEFIPTIEGEDGICYTHPEKLPGVTRDGLSKHFFHRPSKAYTTGTRKRRKIQTECDLQSGETRWHKTGKTRPVLVNGKQKGCKKILVLYTNFGKHRKPEKTNWVMHQYHLGELEEEKEGELVVSKIFYQTQPRQSSLLIEKSTGSCSTSKEVVTVTQSDHHGYNCNLEQLQHMKNIDGNFSFAAFRKPFDEVGLREVPIQARDKATVASMAGVKEHEIGLSSAYHISRPTNPMSTTIQNPLHQGSVVLDHHDPYNLSRMLLQQTNKFQQHQHPQPQPQPQPPPPKLVERSSAGLEELVKGCTSAGNRGEPSIPVNTQDTDWLKYSSYWTDNPDHQ